MIFDQVDQMVKAQSPEVFQLAEANRQVAQRFQGILLYVHRSMRGRPLNRVTISRPLKSTEPGIDAHFQLGVKK